MFVALLVGGGGPIDMEKGTKIKQRTEAGGVKGAVLNSNVKLDPSSEVPLADQLRETWGADAGWVQAVLFYNEVANRPKSKSPKEKKKRKKN